MFVFLGAASERLSLVGAVWALSAVAKRALPGTSVSQIDRGADVHDHPMRAGAVAPRVVAARGHKPHGPGRDNQKHLEQLSRGPAAVPERPELAKDHRIC